MTDPTTFDVAAIQQRLQGDEEHARELLSLFLEYQSSLFDGIADAVSKQDADALGFAAHRAKGALASIHAGVATELTFELEQAGNAGDLSATADLMPRLENAWAELVQELSDYTGAASSS